MRTHHRKLSRKAKKKMALVFADALMKFTGIAMFLIGLGGLAEVPTDPKMIVRTLGLFVGGILVIVWNGYIVDRKGDASDRNQRR